MRAKKVLIVGCTSGIGLELAYLLNKKGYIVGGTGKRENVLQNMTEDLKDTFYSCVFNSYDLNEIKPVLRQMIRKMHGIDICIISTGLIGDNNDLLWAIDEKTIRTNVLGFTAIANFAAHYFIKKGSGHIVGISSLNKFFGSVNHTSFNASKAYISVYLEGLRYRLEHENILVTEICPGFLRAPAPSGFKEFLSVIPIKRAATEVYKAIKNKKKVAYISKRWYLTAWFLRVMPVFLRRYWAKD